MGKSHLRAGLTAALLLLAPAAWAQVTSVAVQAEGELPGFRIEDAAPWVAAQMAQAGLPDWQFTARDGLAPDRVEWSFSLLPYAGGQVRQFIPMARAQTMLGARRLVQAQVRLYLKGEYQTVILGQEAVAGGGEDPALSGFVRRLTLMLDNAYHAIDMTPAPHHHLAP